MTDLEYLIKLSKQVARPAYIALWVLSFLLFLSVSGNLYQSSLTCEFDVEQEFIYSDNNVAIADK